MKVSAPIGSVVCGAFLYLFASISLSSFQEGTVWNGVYTSDQAKRGEQIYVEKCAICHGATLTGSDISPGLIGEEFAKKWNDAPLSQLFDLIRATMPADLPGTLTAPQTADALAFVLQNHGFPANSKELDAKGGLDAIKFVAKKP